MVEPVFGQVIDESVVNTEQRREGAYNGIRVFFTRAAVAIQAITLALVHDLTGFVEGTESQTDLALLGIRLHIGLIPAIFMAIGIIVFWKFFDLTPEKAITLREKIIKLKL
jgi:Na+/melibiose symporter-like transporter